MAEDESIFRTLMIILAAILIVPFVLMVVVMSLASIWGWGHMWSGVMWNGTGMIGVWLVWWLFILLIVVGIAYLLYKWVLEMPDGEDDSAISELRLAYARGEISDEEFDNRIERLQREG